MVQFPKETDSKRIRHVCAYQPKFSTGGQSRRIRLYNIFFLALYLYQITWVVSTIGEPYRKFLEKADKEGFEVMEGSTKMRAQIEHSFRDINDPNRRTKKIGWFDWMDMDIEELAAEKKRDKERSVLDSLPKNMRVPSKRAPSFTPSLLLGILAVVHALVLLMQHWLVGFNVWINYREIDADSVQLPESILELDLEEDEARVLAWKKNPKNVNKEMLDRVISNPPSNLPSHARITPAKGRDVLVPMEYYPTLGMTFEYHRRRYVFDHDNSTWTKIRCQTKFPLDFLETWNGFDSDMHLVSGQIRYGNNTFSVKQPTFGELYKAQLLSPFTVFQLFCVGLWLLDEYWHYSFFTLFMILTFEATVVFSRIKSLGALKGMGNPSRSVFVHRLGKWVAVETSELLPGDIMSLTRVKPHFAKEVNGSDPKKKKTSVKKVEDDGGDVVPADLLLLRGSTVVNEASLTGESVPQMKEGLTEIEKEEHLDMKNKNKMSIAYAGTKMLQCKGAKEVEAQTEAKRYLIPQIPNPPDDGCVCFVLRTGFSSAQGKLVRMIEGSQEKVKGHEKETGLLLLLLFFFAVASSSYVLYHGLQSDKRSKYELLLHCIMIVTSVIPPELPMQMALAVNNSLMTLMKLHIFCTEPYRVPIAGKLDACLFDKTGTLTTDELVAVGVCLPPKLKIMKGKEEEDEQFLTPMIHVHDEAALVLASCHSLVYIEGETTGDPLESASLKSMRWQLSKDSGNAIPSPATEKRAAGTPISVSSERGIAELEVLTRHHFSSKLQRMSCVVKSVATGKHYAVLKGSPEAVAKQLGSKPAGYDEKAEYLSKEGYRVIALAAKPLSSNADVVSAQESRSICENEMNFSGFIAFTCRVRKDTAAVLSRLKEGGMSITMVTGDALLTAVHVAKEVGIIESIGGKEDVDYLAREENDEIRKLIEKKRGSVLKKEKQKKGHKPILLLQEESGSLFWESYESGLKIFDFDASKIPLLSTKYDLATTGKSLALALEVDDTTKTVLGYFRVFARMTPDAKETVIECLHGVDSLCLMCGDGANDVGALKGADVGVALLTGFGDINVDKSDQSTEKAKEKKDESSPPVTAIMSQEHLNQIRAMPVSVIKMKIRSLGTNPDNYPELVEKEDLVQLYQIKSRELAVKRHDQKNALDKKNMSGAEKKAMAKREALERQERLMKRAKELEEQGVSWASFKAMKEIMNEEMEAARRKNGTVKGGGIEASAGALAAQFEDMETGELPMVKLGDASIAAPFTSKMPSIKSCVDIVRQGRCTLVSSLQMYQILALQCLISSYSLSVLYLDGVKYGDTQMTAMGMLGSVSFMSVSRSKPLDRLSSVRPLTSIFHPALFISLLGQFAVHLATMVTAVYFAKKNLPPDHEVDLDGEFKPGILNTVVFLVSNVQQVTVFVVNLQGRPFMTGLTENRPLLWSLVCTFILTFMFASESVPSLNKYFQLVPFPDDDFRNFILKLLLADVGATFLWDRFMKFVFCPDILFASLKGTTLSDVFSLSRTIVVIFFIMYTFLGNEDTWEELMVQEGRLEELGLNLTNLTNATLDADNITSCVGDVCNAILNETATSTIHDEF
ncbi:cation-translocating ATPase [Nitzschia inconspicua]|uniref:Cation-translocating ATPase n=1 Tax=Nitzschia inconspicua TaxID=303405 RepID=A0A9K3L6T1_9STRA|nr:cation-translocating ATPase [Nitzschia inconspicua]